MAKIFPYLPNINILIHRLILSNPDCFCGYTYVYYVILAGQTFLGVVGRREAIISHTTTTNHNFLALMLIKLCLKFAIKRPSLPLSLRPSALPPFTSKTVCASSCLQFSRASKGGENFSPNTMDGDLPTERPQEEEPGDSRIRSQ